MSAGFMLFLFIGVIVVCIGFMVYKVSQFRQRQASVERQHKMTARVLATKKRDASRESNTEQGMG